MSAKVSRAFAAELQRLADLHCEEVERARAGFSRGELSPAEEASNYDLLTSPAKGLGRRGEGGCEASVFANERKEIDQLLCNLGEEQSVVPSAPGLPPHLPGHAA
eukprot:TRINITY_DN17510_c0_g1_i1.p2 TRINITY_DN17510_c0_g1~~TRINITY_DN17510_c0_g1_i1.p2  ORF type:complete len:105 (-),score=21.25 TRINITY_DN17510_c0_g1_i1:33-347(-)